MSADLRARVLAAAAAEPSPTRTAVNHRNWRLGALAAVTGIGVFLVFAGLSPESRLLVLEGEAAPGRHVGRSITLVFATAGGALAIASAALWLALRRGRSMLGRPATWLLFGSVLVPIGLFAWKLGCTLAVGGPMMAWPDRPGLRCLCLSLLVAVGPLLSFLAIRASAPAWPALNGAVLGVAAGACSWFVVDLWCPVAYVPHLLIGHLLPMFILGGTGAVLGRWLLSPRQRR